MEWLNALRGAVVGLDTAPLIYYIEENEDYLDVVRPFFEALDRSAFQIVTSTLTLLYTMEPQSRCSETDRVRRKEYCSHDP